METKYYWSLLILKSSVSASLWSRTGEETTVCVIGGQEKIEDSLADAVDKALSSCSDGVPADAGEPSDVVFGVSPDWVIGGQISHEHLVSLKELCEKLSLKASGFVVISEAIAFDIKQREGASLSAFLFTGGNGELFATRFHLGQPAGQWGGEFSEKSELQMVVGTGLSKLTSDSIPAVSRVILYGDSIDFLNTVRDILIDTDWKEATEGQVSFLHTPQVEIFSARDLLVAISVAASSEMGEISSVVLPDSDSTSGDFDSQDVEDLEVLGREIDSKEHENLSPIDMPSEKLGFVYNQDIRTVEAKPNFEELLDQEDEVEEEEVSSENLHKPTKNSSFANKQRLKGLFSGFGVKKKVVPVAQEEKLHIHKSNARRFPVPLFLLIPILIMAALFGAWYFLPSAEVNLAISPRSLTVRESFAASSGGQLDLATKTIPVVETNQTISGQKTIAATGTKTVGDRAVGVVVIRNGTSSGIRLPAGALLTGPNSLKFTIDESASVSAALSPTTPGTVTVKATASAIGAEYNLPGGDSLSVGGFSKSEIDAVVETGFTGGLSRQITAVSKSDMDTLEKSLTEELTDKVRQKVTESLSDDLLFIPESVVTSVVNRSFDRKVGDEAANLSLNLEVSAVGYSIARETLNALSTQYLSSQIPSGYSFRPEMVEPAISVSGENKRALSISLTANLLPDIDPDSVAASLSGKKTTRAQEIVSSIPGFVRADITITPSFPEAIRFLPFVKNRISVSISKSQ